jgi:hypothetical protein
MYFVFSEFFVFLTRSQNYKTAPNITKTATQTKLYFPPYAQRLVHLQAQSCAPKARNFGLVRCNDKFGLAVLI